MPNWTTKVAVMGIDPVVQALWTAKQNSSEIGVAKQPGLLVLIRLERGLQSQHSQLRRPVPTSHQPARDESGLPQGDSVRRAVESRERPNNHHCDTPPCMTAASSSATLAYRDAILKCLQTKISLREVEPNVVRTMLPVYLYNAVHHNNAHIPLLTISHSSSHAECLAWRLPPRRDFSVSLPRLTFLLGVATSPAVPLHSALMSPPVRSAQTDCSRWWILDRAIGTVAGPPSYA